MKEPNTVRPVQPSRNIPRKKKRDLAPGACSLIVAVFLTFLSTAHAQLPAGTTDATQPQSQKSDPLLDHAKDALSKHDSPTALKLLPTLAEKNPNNAQILYNLAFTQDALAETPAQTTAA